MRQNRVESSRTSRNESFRSLKSVDFTIATNAGQPNARDGPAMLQSIADFFYLSWYLIRSLFKSRESLEREKAEMRRQIAALKAEAAQAKTDDEDERQS